MVLMFIKCVLVCCFCLLNLAFVAPVVLFCFNYYSFLILMMLMLLEHE